MLFPAIWLLKLYFLEAFLMNQNNVCIFLKETKRIFELYTMVLGKFIQDFSDTNSRIRLSLVDFFVKSGGGKSNHLMRDY